MLGRIGDDFAVIMVEGKVDESFGPLLADWLKNASTGKRKRLEFLQAILGLSGALPDGLRYQLLHRTASPLIEAERFSARYAAMVVHSFSESDAWLEDYRIFARLLGAEGTKGTLERVPTHSDPELWIGWVSGAGPAQRVSAPSVAQIALPRVVAHADWGSNPNKRWMCVAELADDGHFDVSSPEPVGEPSTLLSRLHELASGGGVMVGFDFPIGVPAAYASRAGIDRFKDLLPELGSGRWAEFYTVAESAEEIDVARPFYPQRPGGTKQHHLSDALGLDSMSQLLRACERPSRDRGPASPLFWTLGGKQVGKAAIIGWREVLGPALRDQELEVALWPFDGELQHLLSSSEIVVVETYPAEACLHIGMKPPGRGWSKTSQDGRREQRDRLADWASKRPVRLAPSLSALIGDGFGSRQGAEDPFDAMLGLFSMLEVVLGHRAAGAPESAAVRNVEGWILGQAGVRVSYTA